MTDFNIGFVIFPGITQLDFNGAFDASPQFTPATIYSLQSQQVRVPAIRIQR